MKLAKWGELSAHTRDHLDERLRRIPEGELTKLQFWVGTDPDVPDGPWFKDFGTFKVCGFAQYTKTFLDADMDASGQPL